MSRSNAVTELMRAVVASVVAILAGCGQASPSASVGDATPAGPLDLGAQVAAFCGDCHAIPPPDSFPKRAWREQVELGYRLYLESGRNDLVLPPMNRVVEYFETRAPEQLILPPPQEATDRGSIGFERTEVAFPHADPLFPAVAHIRWIPPGIQGGSRLVFCDMNAGEVRQLMLDGRTASTQLLDKIANPDHIEPCDLEGDGVQDFVVADLGSFLPEDHQQGKVVWLPGKPRNEPPLAVLQDQLGRVADVQPGDFDEDGDLDLVVAEFGWRTTGRLLLLEQIAAQGPTPRFRPRVLDDRHGAIHTPVVDLNRDGHLDFVALISQEFEMVVAFLGRGDRSFEQRLVFAAADPSFGSSGIQVVDLDGDGDLDVLHTSGDTLDGFYLKPEHAIRWLENRGGFPFVAHVLTPMPGAMRALAADVDGDRDLDVVACAYLPDRILRGGNLKEYDTVIWLEQVSRGRFVRRCLERSDYGYMCLEVGDFDADGSLDLAVGNFGNRTRTDQQWLTLWWGVPEAQAPDLK